MVIWEIIFTQIKRSKINLATTKDCTVHLTFCKDFSQVTFWCENVPFRISHYKLYNRKAA